MDFIQTVGILDIIFIAILVISVVVGLIRGAIREILSLVGLALSIYLAFKFSDTLSTHYVSTLFESEHVSYVVSFILIIVVTIFAIALLNLLISQLLKVSGLSWFDRLLGLVFGLLRGAIICVVIVTVLGLLPSVTKSNWWLQSSLAPIFKEVANAGVKHMPDSVAKYFDSGQATVNEQIESIKQSIGNGVIQQMSTPTNSTGNGQPAPSSTTPSTDALDQKLKELNQQETPNAEAMLRANGIQLESMSNEASNGSSQAKPEDSKKPVLESYIE